MRTGDATDGIVPFHKLTQWLTYSLLEPLETAGLTVVDLDELTALPEYRNGGLLVDLGAIRPRAPIDPDAPYDVASELIVEWRALTVALMDQLVGSVRDELALGPRLRDSAPAAGRHLARRPQDRARAAPAARPLADPDRAGRHGVLRGVIDKGASTAVPTHSLVVPAQTTESRIHRATPSLLHASWRK